MPLSRPRLALVLAALLMAASPPRAAAAGVAAEAAALSFGEVFARHTVPMLLIEPASGRILDANAAAAAFYGYAQATLRTMRIQDINQLTAEQVAAERALAAREERNYFLFPHRLASGEVRPVEVYSVPFEVQGQRLLLSMVHDLSAQRVSDHERWRYQVQLEEAVRRSVQDIERLHRQRLLLGAAAGVLQLLLIAGLAAWLWRSRQLQREAEAARDAEAHTAAALRAGEARLREELAARQRLENLIWGTDLATWEWDLTSDALQVNERWAAMLGYRRAQLEPLTRATWRDLLHPADLQRHEAALQRHQEGDAPLYEAELRLRHRDGHWVWILERGKVVERDEVGRVRRMAGVSFDITERKRAEDELALAASVFTHAQEGILITDERTRIVRVNDAFCSLTGYTREEVLGQTPALLRSGRHDEAFYRAMWDELQRHGFWIGEIWNRRKDGRDLVELMAISAVRDGTGEVRHYVGLFFDITDQKLREQRLEHEAFHDALTGLGNRLLLRDRLQQAIARAQRHGGTLALAYLDLDGFKAINDTHGHAVGDQLLRVMAERMRSLVRSVDTVARLGGDEFVVLIADLQDPRQAEPLLRRLLAALAEPVEYGGQRLQVTASIGVAFLPTSGAHDPDQLLRQADQAMYQAKQTGRNRVHVHGAPDTPPPS
ncbi:putative diguanylate cyclase YegE [Tepidimonas sediminis]|uniref:Putative diguanylate cyclase YegE n=1 Tax=Tepidimonas sediminis TaxID=2588941 RepID=A0A554WQM7_9BURK|nr:sensor domain-containing diguanylate cyclase [Tepidimonas sediminis]TSE25877.1 putative diguanylate cyclase YegE [Tepidimonas sediminis]